MKLIIFRLYKKKNYISYETKAYPDYEPKRYSPYENIHIMNLR